MITHEEARKIAFSLIPKIIGSKKSQEKLKKYFELDKYIRQQEKHNTPMKPLKDGSYDICPNCKECLPVKWSNVYRKHCGNCGQALDWSETK